MLDSILFILIRGIWGNSFKVNQTSIILKCNPTLILRPKFPVTASFYYFSCWNCITTITRFQLCVLLCIVEIIEFCQRQTKLLFPQLHRSISTQLKKWKENWKRYFNSKVNCRAIDAWDSVYVEYRQIKSPHRLFFLFHSRFSF